MSVVMAAVAPHPPIILPEIGGAECAKVSDTIDAMRALFAEVRARDVTHLVCMSPHHFLYGPEFAVASLPDMAGDLSAFGVPGLRLQAVGDPELAGDIVREALKAELPATLVDGQNDDEGFQLDHGFLVPYYFADRAVDYRVVELSIAQRPLEIHYRLGSLMGRVLDASSARVCVIASGDLSHRLTRGAPAGYSPSGADFDKLIVEKVSMGDFSDIMNIPHMLVEEAGECGLRSIVTLAGLLEGRDYGSQVLSYEGPFGVGYMVSMVKFA